MIGILNEHETVIGPSRKPFICVYRWLCGNQSTNLCSNQRSILHITCMNYLYMKLMSNLYISCSLRLKMTRHLYLGQHLLVILTLYVLSCCLHILNNYNNWLIIRISSPSISSRSSTSDTVGCASLPNHLPLIRISRGYSPRPYMRFLDVICPRTIPCCSPVMLPISNCLI